MIMNDARLGLPKQKGHKFLIAMENGNMVTAIADPGFAHGFKVRPDPSMEVSVPSPVIAWTRLPRIEFVTKENNHEKVAGGIPQPGRS